MDPFTVALIAGTGLQLYGNFQANKQRQKAEEANAHQYALQRQQILAANRREADIFRSEAAGFIGDQVSAIARSGIDFSGSVTMRIAASKARSVREMNAIIEHGRSQAETASILGRTARDTANFYGSGLNQGAAAMGTILNAAVAYKTIG